MARITDEELRGLAHQGLNILKYRIDHDQRRWLLASYHIGESLHPMTHVEEQIDRKAGEEWLNNASKKAAVFKMLRSSNEFLPPDAIAIAFGANGFKVTDKGNALPPEKLRAILIGGHERHHTAVIEGYMEVDDILACVVQTPERVAFANLPRVPDAVIKCNFMDQSDFTGSLKMFGTPISAEAFLSKI